MKSPVNWGKYRKQNPKELKFIMYLHLISLLAILMPEPKKDLPKYVHNLQKTKNITAQYCLDARMRSGQCVTLSSCPHMVEEFYREAHKTSYGSDFQTFASSSICGFDGGNFLICCHRTTLYPFALSTSPTETPFNPVYYMTTRPPIEHDSTRFTFAKLNAYTSTTQRQTTTSINNNYPIYPTNYPMSAFTEMVFNPTMATPMVPETQTATSATTQNSLIIQLSDQAMLPTSFKTCGVNRGIVNRVVGGSEAKRGNYPWMAALGYRDVFDPSLLQYLCAGSLISSKYVITSAHCINSQLTIVRLGAHNLTNTAEPGALNFHVKRTVLHDKFDLKSITNDLALIELIETVIMTKYINSICLPEEPKFLNEDFVGMNPFIAGWGAQQYHGPTSQVLRDVQVPIINRQVCEQSYRTVFKYVNLSEMLICAGNSVADACQGDSGGALMWPMLSDSTFHYHLLGVVSFGYECARTGFPGIYTKVAAYLPWIKSNMV